MFKNIAKLPLQDSSTTINKRHATTKKTKYWYYVILALVMFMVLLLLAPIFTVLSYVIFPDAGTAEVWQHLSDTVLQEYIINSIFLVLGVSFIAVLFGVSTAWFTSNYRFPGHKIFPLMLMLPMAMPSYIIAFTYSGLLDTSGVVQRLVRSTFGLDYGEYWFPEIHSLWGAIVMLGFVLYPYVFLLARASFLTQSAHAIQVGQTLGLNAKQRFFRIALPLSRPAIIAGIALVVMETLSDYGTVQFYGVPTFATGIVRTWAGLDELGAAINLSAMLLGMVLLFFGLETFSRRKLSYNNSSKSSGTLHKQTPKKSIQWGIFTWCLFPVMIGFIIPVTQLLIWASSQFTLIDQEFLLLCWNSLYLALITALIAVSVTFFIYTFQRLHASSILKNSFRLVSLGYAIPGVVVAITVMIPASFFSNYFGDLLTKVTGNETSFILNGTIGLLIFAYMVRFIAVALGNVESGYNKIAKNIDEVARSLHTGFMTMIYRIHLPMIKKALLTALLIIFVDVLKELPTTLLLRPFNFNTLAVSAFELASDEFLYEAALPAVFIIVTGLIPVYILNRSIDK